MVCQFNEHVITFIIFQKRRGNNKNEVKEGGEKGAEVEGLHYS
jgi:hypothetical protein